MDDIEDSYEIIEPKMLIEQRENQNKKLKIIMCFIEHPEFGIKEICNNLDMQDIEVDENEVNEVLKNEFSGYGKYGQDLKIHSQEQAYRHFTAVINNQDMMYAKLYDVFISAIYQFENGEISGRDFAAISKELRMREEQMLKTINGFFSKGSMPDTAIQVNNNFDVSELIHSIKRSDKNE